MLQGLACFEPSGRWSIGHAMRSPLFERYRLDEADASLAASAVPTAGALQYMHYLQDDA